MKVTGDRTSYGQNRRPSSQGALPRLSGRRLGIGILVFIAVTWSAGFVAGFTFSLMTLTVFGFLAAIYGLRDPNVGLFGVGILCTLDTVSRAYLLTGGLLRWNTFNYLLLLIAGLNLGLLFRANFAQTRILLVLWVISALQTFYTEDVAEGAQHLLVLAAPFGLLVYFIRARGSRSSWIWLALALGLLGALGGLVFLFYSDSLPQMNGNAYAFFPLTALVAICFGAYITQALPQVQWLLLSLAVPNLLWVFFSSSRGGLLDALICVVFVVCCIKSKTQRLVVIGAAVVCILGITPFFVDEEAAALHKLAKLMDDDFTIAQRTNGRSDIARAGWNEFLNHPLMGIGTGSFGERFAKAGSQGVSTVSSGTKKEAHSGWIKTLTENGIFGFAALTAYILSFVYDGFRYRQRGDGSLSLGIFIATFLSVALLSTEFQAKGLWFIACVGTVLLRSRFNPARRLVAVRTIWMKRRPDRNLIAVSPS